MPKQKGADRLGQRLSAPKTITRGRFRLVENLLRAFRRFTSFQIIILGFAGVIVAGALLLMLPAASAAGAATPFTDALFTSTSAVCVTGLVVRDSGSYWSPFGQSLILLLIQIGGLGVITMSATFLMLAGRNISLKERSAMQDALSAPSVGGIVRLTRFILKGTFIVELTGALVMLPVFWRDHGFRGIWMAVFHSVSAFCNAGFDILGTAERPYPSLTAYVGNPVVNITVIFLLVVGGLGFLTWDDIRTHRWRLSRYRMQSKVILATTAILLLFPAVLFFFTEYSAFPLQKRILASLFQSATPRTAGFNTTDLAAMSDASRAVMILLMLVGGMKVTTLAVLAANVHSIFRQQEWPQLFHRRVDSRIVKSASAVLLLYLTLFLTGGCIISAAEDLPLAVCLYETASAIGTVGLTLGITPQLGQLSHWILILLMFWGRVGGLTLIYAAFAGHNRYHAVYPKENITIG